MSKLQLLKKIVIVKLALIISITIIATIIFSNSYGGYGQIAVEAFLFITLSPLFVFYAILYWLIALASKKDKKNKVTIYTLTLLVFSPWILLLGIILIDSYGNRVKHKVYKADKYYVDKARFSQGRPCAEILFKCLPESQNAYIQDQSKHNKENIEYLTLTPKVLARYKQVLQDWDKNLEGNPNNPNAISVENKKFVDQIQKKEFINKMELAIEEHFPDYWLNVEKVVVHRWLRLAMEKATALSIDAPYDVRGFIQLCARIGLSFDSDPKWKPLSYYLSYSEEPFDDNGRAVDALDYFDLTVLEKAKTTRGYEFKHKYLYKILEFLPAPKRSDLLK